MAKRKTTIGQKRSTNTTQKTKDQATQIPLKARGDLGCPGRVSSSCSTISF